MSEPEDTATRLPVIFRYAFAFFLRFVPSLFLYGAVAVRNFFVFYDHAEPVINNNNNNNN